MGPTLPVNSALALTLAKKTKPKPKPSPPAAGKGTAVPLPGYRIRQGLDTPTQWGGRKGASRYVA